MSLRDVAALAERLAAAGDEEAAAARLEEASRAIDPHESTKALREFAETCHRWGGEDVEEVVVRVLLDREARVEDMLRLLDLLQQRLNGLQGSARIPVVVECLRLGTDALRLLGEGGPLEETRANLYHSRGLRHLDLGREGHLDHLEDARSDIHRFTDWLRKNETVPAHLQRGNLIAFAEVDVAEALLLEGRKSEAASLLEGAIGVLEAAKVAGWMTKRAYALLERAWG